MVHDPDYYIENLMLIQHPEGGYYKETYRSDECILTAEHLKRNVSTGIYYLLKEHEFSAFHRIKSDEMWHFYDGTGILEILILKDNTLKIQELGLKIDQGQSPQILVPANHWFAARIKNNNGFVLAGCTVAPGFDFKDFEMAKADQLRNDFPSCKEIILKYCR